MARYRLFSFINVSGLGIGLAIALLILTHLRNEFSYESGFPKHELIYRVASTNWAKMPPILAGQLKTEMPEINEIGRLYFLTSRIMSYNEDQIVVEKPHLADPEILEMFDLKFIEGTPHGALNEPNDIVLTERIANRFFKPGETRLGAEIEMVGQQKYYVSAIVEDLPQNSHLKIDCFMPLEGTWVADDNSRGWRGVSIYALFDSKHDAQKLSSKLLAFQERFQKDDYTPGEIAENGDFYELHPIDEIHLNSHREKETEANSYMAYVYIFAALGVFILLVVIINFINLYMAQTLNRLKEVGIRKVIGAVRRQLAAQFLTESFFLVFISAILALALVYTALPYYNNLASIKIGVRQLFSLSNLAMLLGLIALVGLVAGGFPAYYLSKFGISYGLKTGQQKINHRLPMRTGMVAFQFLIAVFLFTCTLIVSKQMSFINKKDLGFNKEEVVAYNLHGDLWHQVVTNPDKVRSELLSHADIKQVGMSSAIMGDRFSYEAFKLPENPDTGLDFRYMWADEHFSEVMGIEIVEGGITKGLQGTRYILNETARDNLQLPNLTGKIAINENTGNKGQIIGIAEDFHFASLHNKVEPLVIEIPQDLRYAGNYLLIRVNTRDIKSTLGYINTTLEGFAPKTPLVHRFLDEHLDNLYSTENDMFAIFKVFSSIIIGLACLGLFALFAFVSQARTKELGIRKTLGASMVNLLMLLSKRYLIMLLITILAVIPVSWFFATEWLANFAYRVFVDWWIFVAPGLIVLCLATIAMMSQSWKVAVRNPINSLRDE